MTSRPVLGVVPDPTEETKRNAEVPLSSGRSDEGRGRVGLRLKTVISAPPPRAGVP